MKKSNYGKFLKYFYYISVTLLTVSVGSAYIYKMQVSAEEMKYKFDTSNLSKYVETFYPWMLAVSSGLAIVMFIYSGYLYVTSAGNVDTINKAKEYIVGALSGLAFLILAALIFNSLKI